MSDNNGPDKPASAGENGTTKVSHQDATPQKNKEVEMAAIN